MLADPSRSVGFADVGDSFAPDFLDTILSEGDCGEEAAAFSLEENNSWARLKLITQLLDAYTTKLLIN